MNESLLVSRGREGFRWLERKKAFKEISGGWREWLEGVSSPFWNVWWSGEDLQHPFLCVW